MANVGRHGAGSITKRRDGRLQVAVTMADGRRIYRYARDERTADRVRAELAELRDAEVDPTRQTLAAFLRSWISSLRKARHRRLRPRTLAHYALIVERHIIPSLGQIQLQRLGGRRIQVWLDADRGAPRSVRHHRAVLRRALNVAVGQRLLVRNPAIAVELPVVDWRGAQPLTLEEARRLLEATGSHRLGVLWRVALATGLRQGELLGLAWEDVDLETGRLRVTAQLQRIEGQWVRSQVKAARTLATIAIAGETLATLRAHRTRMAAERRADWAYHGLVFVTSGGLPYHGAEVLKAFHRACDRAGIERRRFHDLRGSTATLMSELGVPEEVRMARLGHATTAMARHYAQVRESLDRDAAERLERAIGG